MSVAPHGSGSRVDGGSGGTPDAKDWLKATEGSLADAPFVEFQTFEREGRRLHVAITDRLRKAARNEGVWRSREMLATLKNAAYGFDERLARKDDEDWLVLADCDRSE